MNEGPPPFFPLRSLDLSRLRIYIFSGVASLLASFSPFEVPEICTFADTSFRPRFIMDIAPSSPRRQFLRDLPIHLFFSAFQELALVNNPPHKSWPAPLHPLRVFVYDRVSFFRLFSSDKRQTHRGCIRNGSVAPGMSPGQHFSAFLPVDKKDAAVDSTLHLYNIGVG